MANPHHQLSVHRRVGSLTLAVDLHLHAEWTILFGPSGSGKSSILRAACGLLGKQGIHFTRNNETLQDETTFIPPNLRDIRWAPQNASLFPHLSVRENLTFGATATGQPLLAGALDEVITLFQLQPLLTRRPGDLSGGEAQRVNLARAFAAPSCRLMLLDEPFTGIDRPLRDHLLPQMRSWLTARAIPAISVTHDVEEALQLEAEVVLLHDGMIQAEGHVSKVLTHERERLLKMLKFRP